MATFDKGIAWRFLGGADPVTAVRAALGSRNPITAMRELVDLTGGNAALSQPSAVSARAGLQRATVDALARESGDFSKPGLQHYLAKNRMALAEVFSPDQSRQPAITTYNTDGTIKIVVNFVSRGMRGSFASLMPDRGADRTRRGRPHARRRPGHGSAPAGSRRAAQLQRCFPAHIARLNPR
jgi:hypothetical protein